MFNWVLQVHTDTHKTFVTGFKLGPLTPLGSVFFSYFCFFSTFNWLNLPAPISFPPLAFPPPCSFIPYQLRKSRTNLDKKPVHVQTLCLLQWHAAPGWWWEFAIKPRETQLGKWSFLPPSAFLISIFRVLNLECYCTRENLKLIYKWLFCTPKWVQNPSTRHQCTWTSTLPNRLLFMLLFLMKKLET